MKVEPKAEKPKVEPKAEKPKEPPKPPTEPAPTPKAEEPAPPPPSPTAATPSVYVPESVQAPTQGITIVEQAPTVVVEKPAQTTTFVVYEEFPPQPAMFGGISDDMLRSSIYNHNDWWWQWDSGRRCYSIMDDPYAAGRFRDYPRYHHQGWCGNPWDVGGYQQYSRRINWNVSIDLNLGGQRSGGHHSDHTASPIERTPVVGRHEVNNRHEVVNQRAPVHGGQEVVASRTQVGGRHEVTARNPVVGRHEVTQRNPLKIASAPAQRTQARQVASVPTQRTQARQAPAPAQRASLRQVSARQPQAVARQASLPAPRQVSARGPASSRQGVTRGRSVRQ